MNIDRIALGEALIPAVLAAGSAILEVYRSDFAIREKSDASPVTEADEHAETILVDALTRLTPGVPIVAEEAVSDGRVPEIGDAFWLVDPLDGTREFVSRNGEFTVNVGLIEGHRPTLGVVLAPALGRLYWGAEGAGAFVADNGRRQAISARSIPGDGAVVVASRLHGDTALLDAYLARRRVASLRNAGSSLKFCLIASGEADLYPRFGRTMEWDTAAADAVLRAAGGTVEDVDGRTLQYGKPDFENPHFIARGR